MKQEEVTVFLDPKTKVQYHQEHDWKSFTLKAVIEKPEGTSNRHWTCSCPGSRTRTPIFALEHSNIELQTLFNPSLHILKNSNSLS